jgi:hypothetical protein
LDNKFPNEAKRVEGNHYQSEKDAPTASVNTKQLKAGS